MAAAVRAFMASSRVAASPAAGAQKKSEFSGSQFSAKPTAAFRRPTRGAVVVRAGDDDKKIAKDKVKLNFAIKLSGTAYGEQVCVVGNTDKLGRWDGQNGVYLKWSEGDVWKGSVEVPAGGYVEYKLLVKGKHGDMRWEKHHNRVVQLYDGGADLTISGRFDGSLNITKKDAKKNVTVAFNIHKRIPFGHEIAVVGGAKEFGAWNVDDAMPLRWSEGDVWKGETELTSGGQVEYKMITRRIRTGQWKSEFRRDFKRVVQVYSGGNTIQITGEYRGLVDVRLKGSKPKEEKKEE